MHVPRQLLAAQVISALVIPGLGITGLAGHAPGTEPVSALVTPDRIDFKVGKDLVTSYAVGPKIAKPYFFPVNAPGGVSLTRAWPMENVKGEATDHVHQKSLWFCHGDVIPEGVELKQRIKGVEGVDFWSETKGHGVIACTKVEKPTEGPGRAGVVTRNEWRTADGDKILDETRGVTLHDLGGAYLLVVDIDLHASVCPITFADTKEGSFGARVRETIRGDRKGRLTNAEGNTGEGKANNLLKDGCWGLKSAWCDYSGPSGDDVAGLAIFAPPTNPGPTYWHSRNYGLMAANPFGRKKAGFPDAAKLSDLVKLAKGEHLKLKYGVYLHRGDAKEGKVADGYERFVKLAGAAPR